MEEAHAVPDEDIVKQVQDGDSESFGLLMKRYEPKLLRYITRFTGERDLAHEIVQETFIHAYRNIRGFDTTKRFSPWIYRIAHNQAINELRRSARSSLHIDLDLLALFPAEENTSDHAEAEITHAHIETNLNKLSPHYREVLVLFYLEELDYQSIADVLHIPISTVGVRLNRARRALKKLLDPAYA